MNTTGMRMVVVALIIAPAMRICIAAHDHPSSEYGRRHHQYQVIDLGSISGPESLCSSPGSNVISARAARDRWTATHVRSDNDRILEVLLYAIGRSPSFIDLIETLEQLDRVVYIEEGTCHHRELRACLQMMSTPGGKNLLVRIDPRQPIRSVVAQLAHELYHAVEIAREPEVVDAGSLRDLYERIGERSCFSEANPCWETRAAVAFEALVARQLSEASGKSHGSR
jgi:hypothetical protein